MATVALWWAALTVLGWVCLPITVVMFRYSRLRGYAYSRVIGLLLVSYVFWLLNIVGILPNTTSSLWGVVAAVVLSGALVGWRQRRHLAALLRAEWRTILVCELVFAGVLLAYAAHKSFDPAIDHTEEPMDMAMLSGILASPRLPPNDPWLSGHAISYYYLGYLVVSVVARLTFLTAGIAYNLGLAHTAALAAAALCGVLLEVMPARSEPDRQRRRLSLVAAPGAVAIMCAGNLEGLVELAASLGIGSARLYGWLGIAGLTGPAAEASLVPEGGWWWWRASRIIVDANFLGRTPTVITEFPAFSLVLGDLHPHLMALPLLAVGLGVALELCLSGRADVPRVLLRQTRLYALGLVVGALGFANSWDLPTALAISGAAYLLGRSSVERWSWQKAAWAGLVIAAMAAAAVLPYLPFYSTLSTQVRGLGLAYYAKTPLKHYVLCLGLWLVPITGDVVLRARTRLATGTHKLRRVYLWAWLGLLLAPWLFTLVVGGWGRLLLGLATLLMRGPWLLAYQAALLVLLGGEIAAAVARREDAPSMRVVFPDLLVWAGIALTYATEFVYLRDVFETRTNTVFKFHYQAWILLGLGAIVALVRLWRRSARSRALAGLCGVLLIASLWYTGAAAYTRAEGYQDSAGLDGTAHLQAVSPGEYEALQWLSEHLDGNDVIVEAPGEEFVPYTSRSSAFTGVPTVIGWPGHEIQWRGDDAEVERRLSDVGAIYTLRDREQVLGLLDKYDATCVIVGPYERQRYGLTPDDAAWFTSIMPLVYDGQGVRIYAVDRDNTKRPSPQKG